jgi:hypothetical protein
MIHVCIIKKTKEGSVTIRVHVDDLKISARLDIKHCKLNSSKTLPSIIISIMWVNNKKSQKMEYFIVSLTFGVFQ